MDVSTVKLPAFLASALVNGDTSGLECSCGAMPKDAGGRDRLREVTHTGQCDFRWLAAALAYVAAGHVSGTACTCGREDDADECAPGCGEAYFSWSCALPGYSFGADMLDYTVLT